MAVVFTTITFASTAAAVSAAAAVVCDPQQPPLWPKRFVIVQRRIDVSPGARLGNALWETGVPPSTVLGIGRLEHVDTLNSSRSLVTAPSLWQQAAYTGTL